MAALNCALRWNTIFVSRASPMADEDANRPAAFVFLSLTPFLRVQGVGFQFWQFRRFWQFW
jgi:hypothetical protein